MRIGVVTKVVLVQVLLGATAVAWGQGAGPAPQSAPTALNPAPNTTPLTPPTTQPVHDARLEVTPAEYQLGDVWESTPCKREFTLKNVGPEALKLTAESSCGCTVPTQPKSPLEPGESSTFTVTYDSKRVGVVHKKVFLKLAETKQVLWEIPVEGNIKAVYTATPPAPITFDGLEADSVATKTVKLENKYGAPVPLKLIPPEGESTFDMQLKEIQPGMEYELSVTTKPPLRKGFNSGLVSLETGLPGIEKLQFHISANVQPRIIATPMRLMVPPDSTTPLQQVVRVQYRTDKPVKVLNVRSDQGPVQWELIPAPALPPTAKLASHQLRVTLPAASELPAGGARLIITTDDPAPEFKEMTIPIVRGGPLASAPAATTQPQAVPAGQILTTAPAPGQPMPTPVQKPPGS
jgi:hypothetical protein